MKGIKILALSLTIPFLIASCGSSRINGNPKKEDRNSTALIHPETNNDPYILGIYNICSSIDVVEYDPVAVGSHINVRCSVDEDNPNRTENMTMYVLPQSDTYSWNTRDAVCSCRSVMEDSSSDIQILLFSCDLPSNMETGTYTLVFAFNDNKVDSMFDITVDTPENSETYVSIDKPVIYLYPEEETEVFVGVDFEGDLTCTYPAYHEGYGWHVTAMPDGTLYNIDDGRTYDYLFWEGLGQIPGAFDHAACVPGCDTAAFLEEYLEAAGLNSSEIDDFISFWLPKMQNNPYNLIAFPTEGYEETASLNVSPAPDTTIRVYMVFTALDGAVDIAPENALTMPEPVERTGFTVVEWGGSQF